MSEYTPAGCDMLEGVVPTMSQEAELRARIAMQRQKLGCAVTIASTPSTPAGIDMLEASGRDY